MKTLGITGGIGMGKSKTTQLLQQRGIPVVDTDQLAREVVEPGEPALGEIRNTFGAGVLDASGALKRDELARLVFADPIRRERLETILHPRIRARWLDRVERWRTEELALGVVVIPLLFETDSAGYFDSVICVACSTATQLDRLRSRGWSEEEIQQRIKAQWPIEDKTARSQFVIWTEGEVNLHAEQLDRILQGVRPA